MKREYTNKISAIIVGVIFAIFCVLSAHAQDLKAILLKPAVWICVWSNPSTGYIGKGEIVFESRGDKVVAKIETMNPDSSATGPVSCERDVIISADTVKFDGCIDRNIVLIFDPNDKVYLFKSKTETVNGLLYKLREK